MTDETERALLPTGLQDLLPPLAAFEAATVERLMASFASYGYERVKPPLIEFESGLLAGAGHKMSAQTFRLMDPVSQRVMGVRADMTPQLARIATTRLGGAPRPLRLSYAGQVLRVKGSQLRPERQFTQVGVEMIGAPEPAADAEVVLLAAEALAAIGVEDITIDLTLPPLVGTVCSALGLDDETTARARAALDRKDRGAIRDIGGQAADVLGAMMDAAGRARSAIEKLAEAGLPEAARKQSLLLGRMVELIEAAGLDLQLTVDPVEHRGFEYHTGVSFSIFAGGVRGELGGGGRYMAEAGRGEPSTGFSLYMDTVLRAIGAPARGARLYLPFGTGLDRARALRSEGWVTVQGLTPEADVADEARRLCCSHVLRDDTPVPLEGKGA